jgi:hypothetical protein
MRDSIIFSEDQFETALSFYIEALSEGIMAKWGGRRFIKGLDSYYVVEVDARKTIELKNKKEV